jgi:DNA polymerase
VDEIERCKRLLDLERHFVKPHVILALGKSALRSLTGHTGTLKSVRGQTFLGSHGEAILATVHPSYLLRLPEGEARNIEYRKFVDDLAHAQSLTDSMAQSMVRALAATP